MFCPTCGRENPGERRFCASCGTNLELVSQALSGYVGGVFSKIDAGLDQFIARYSEHIFKDAPTIALDRGIGKSWKVLWRGAVTSLVDMFLFWLMWNILPLRFFMLLIATPIAMLLGRASRQKSATAEIGQKRMMALPESWPREALPSVIEHTTQSLPEHRPTEQDKALKTD